MTPGRKFSMTISARSINRSATSLPRGFLRSIAIERLLRLKLRKDAPSPSMKRFAMLQWRIQSPLIGSILMISAPRSPSIWVANGPWASWAKSATTSPASGPAMIGVLQLLSIEERRQQTAVDAVAAAGAEGGLVAGEEEDEVGDLLRLPDPAQRMEAPPLGDRRLRVVRAEGVCRLVDHRRADRAGGDAVAADVVV